MPMLSATDPGGTMKHCITTGVVAALFAIFASSASAHPQHHCHVFTGPGDTLVHSTNFRVKNTTCAKAHHVIFEGFGYHRYRASGRVWTTHKTGGYGPLGYKQVWLSGDKRIWLWWID